MNKPRQNLPDEELLELEKEVKSLLTDFEEEKAKSKELKDENYKLRDRLSLMEKTEQDYQEMKEKYQLAINEKVEQSKPQLRAVKSDEPASLSESSSLTKEALADVLIEAQTTADRIVRKAEKKAEDILVNKQEEFQAISQQAEQYREKMIQMKQVTDHLLGSWIDQLDDIIEELK
ncbi:hypothetical protein ACRW9N_10415 [Listeria aquatica]|uniref:Uncharacterized protein n=1 Tax=Listeria aquatica FSL S10-1188 TaxID=1265818 RepID=W7BAC4_9LIST|nr:hypothetical protein [Listeria aquatica]EUJ21635.1 hypothetical protein MAQA_02947 [Listeria aquatica FSL S10-1188]